jgi:hypothetical protein
MKPTQKKPKSKFDSHCIVCKKPAHSPKGNFNAKRVTLCKSVKCRHLRKIELQRARRAQKELFGKTELRSLILPDDKNHKAIGSFHQLKASNKASIGGNSQVHDEQPSSAQLHQRPSRKSRHIEGTSHQASEKPLTEKRVLVL